MSRRRRVSAKVNLRKIYALGGYRCEYSRFIREKVVPVIGVSALHALPSRRGSRVREFEVTSRNYTRVLKSLGLDQKTSNRSTLERGAARLVESLGAEATGKMLIQMLEAHRTISTEADKPVLEYRIPVHGFSNNYQYVDIPGGRKACTPKYNKWKEESDAILSQMVRPEDKSVIDFTAPLHIDMHFVHKPNFDTLNFVKSAVDLLGRVLDFDDKIVKSSGITGSDCSGFSDGWITFRIRNI